MPLSSEHVSIVIPCYVLDDVLLDLTQRCVMAIEEHTPQPHGIIVVDNASPIGTLELCRMATEGYLRNTRNLGYAGGVNAGLRAARGPWLAVMNNDVEVVDGWLEAMQLCWEEEPIGLDKRGVGAISAHVARRDPQRTHRCNDATASPKHMAGMLWLTRREVVDHVGYLDEGYGWGMFEDRDYWARLLEAGYRLRKAGWCHHAMNQTWRRMPGEERAALYERNRARYNERWGDKWPL